MVKWEGYSEEENTWENEANCEHADKAIKTYWNSIDEEESRNERKRKKNKSSSSKHESLKRKLKKGLKKKKSKKSKTIEISDEEADDGVSPLFSRAQQRVYDQFIRSKLCWFLLVNCFAKEWEWEWVWSCGSPSS